MSQNTLRVARVFWALDASLASRRHFPSINWLQSYSLYINDLAPWFGEHLSKEFVPLRQKALEVLQKEAELQEIVQLVGVDALPEREKAILDVARMIREDYLQQSAYDDVDTYSSIQKQYRMLRAILQFGDDEQGAIEKGVLDVARMIREDYLQQSAYDDVDTYTSIQKQYRMLRTILAFGDREQEAIARGATVAQLQGLPVRTKLSRMKWIPEAETKTQFDSLELEMTQAVAAVAAGAS